MDTNEKYLLKENYVTRDANPDLWSTHSNIILFKRYEKYITGDVLDIGCNHGATTFHLSYNPYVKTISGADINSDALKVALKIFENCKKPYQFHDINIVDDYIHWKFNSIVCFHTFEHIFPEDVDKFLQNIRNMMCANAHLIIAVPYDKTYDDGHQHVAYYTSETLSEPFVRNGFKVVECYDSSDLGDNLTVGVFQKS